jgi:tetratricopeptide (TPR) repeat protein
MIELLLQAEGALSVGMLDRAEALYRQVIAADPRNSIAVVGLARVALERSDEVGALTLARRALAIDPENNAGQRMVQRIEDALRTRGVSVGPGGAGPGGAARAEVDAGAEVEAAAGAEVEPAATARTGPQPRATAPDRRSCLDRVLRRRPKSP